MDPRKRSRVWLKLSRPLRRDSGKGAPLAPDPSLRPHSFAGELAPAPRLTCLAPILGAQRCYPWGVGLNGGIVPTLPGQDQGGDRADPGNVPGAIQTGFVLLLLVPCPPPGWPPPSCPPPRTQTLPQRLLLGLGPCSCCLECPPPNPKHFVRVEVSPQHDSALRSWASFPPGPALLSQLSCPVTPHLGSTLPGPCPSLPLPFLHVLYRPGPNSNPPILQK